MITLPLYLPVFFPQLISLSEHCVPPCNPWLYSCWFVYFLSSLAFCLIAKQSSRYVCKSSVHGFMCRALQWKVGCCIVLKSFHSSFDQWLKSFVSIHLRKWMHCCVEYKPRKLIEAGVGRTQRCCCTTEMDGETSARRFGGEAVGW
jgi:hypothetical protein